MAIKATKGRSAFDAMLFLKEVLKKCTNRPTFSLTEVLGTNGLLKFLDLIIIMKRSARGTKVFSNNINAKKLHIKALNVMLRVFFAFLQLV
ncbi:MAG: hypothetical protein ACP5LF_02205 [Nitrososphaeria archaeon]